jgi:hypothetical protein
MNLLISGYLIEANTASVSMITNHPPVDTEINGMHFIVFVML